MLKKWIKALLPALLAIPACLASSCDVFVPKSKYDFDPKDKKYLLPTEITNENDYYYGFDFSKSGQRLQKALHVDCFAKHTTWINYYSVGSYYYSNSSRPSIDGIPGTNNIELFYTNKSVAQGSSTTREHVWPAANSSGLWDHDTLGSGTAEKDYFGGGSDLYHVRPCNSKVNTARGNSRFVDFLDYPEFNFTEVTDGGPQKLKLYGLDQSGQYASKAEPPDSMKGDVARILCYCYVHYCELTTEGIDSKYAEYCSAHLALTDVMGYTKKDDCYRTLANWNRIDPPSEVEKQRNNTVQKIQGNRNPFVDYPGLIEKMFNIAY